MTKCTFLAHTTHRYWRAKGPVRSPIFKPVTGESVVRWVTTSESSLLYVYSLFFALNLFSI